MSVYKRFSLICFLEVSFWIVGWKERGLAENVLVLCLEWGDRAGNCLVLTVDGETSVLKDGE